jgi:hypothetical protein
MVGATVAAVLIGPRAASAQGTSPLVLPLLAALAIAQQAADTAREEAQNPIEARMDEPSTPAPSFRSRLPGQLKIPDVYKVDFHRDARRWAEPIDSTNYLILDLWPAPVGPLGGVTPLVSYDQESRFIGDSSDILRFELEVRW